MLREGLGKVRYVAAAYRPGKRRSWVSRELKPTDSKAQRLSFGLCASVVNPLRSSGFEVRNTIPDRKDEEGNLR